MLSATVGQPVENSKAAPKQINKAWLVTAYSLGRKCMGIQQFATCKIRERRRGPPELNGWTGRGGSRGEAGSSSLSLLPEPSPKQDVRTWGSQPWTPCRWWAGQPLQPWGRHILAGLVWPCCGFAAGTAETLPCIPFTDPYTVVPSGF